MFEKTLTDVVKGIRASKRDTALFISQCIAEIKTELTSADMHVKANALQKLTFLQMMGYTMNWASFATIEVMSSPRFAHKRIGYLAASQGFTQDTEVILLTTNLLQKELRGAAVTNLSTNQDGVYEAGLAINCISNIVTADLAADLLPEMTQLTSHPQPYLRKKAILCLFKLFVHYPQGLRLTFGKLQACLQDPNQAVVSCAVNVITELSDKNPKNYLSLAPAFFDLLTGSSNNWMLIKVVKLLGSLVPEEPRLARKLLEPLANIVRTTQAKSLLYEAVHTITLCLPYCPKPDGSMPAIVPEVVQLSAQTLRSLVEESDQNLKYLGLVGFASLMQSHPRVLSSAGVGDARPLILACLSDPDVTIRKRALDLLMGLATRKNVVDLVSQLMQHVPLARGRGNYRHDLVAKILEICSSDKYSLLSDASNAAENHFEWYFNHVLLKLAHLLMIHGGGSSSEQTHPHAQRLHDEIVNVALRVLPVRTHAVQRAFEIILWRSHFSEEGMFSGDDGHGNHGGGVDGKQHIVMPEILPALAWIVGEYSDLLPVALENAHLPPMEGGASTNGTNSKGPYHAIVQVLSSPWNVKKLPTTCQKVYLQAVVKVLAAGSAAASSVEERELEACVATLELNLPIFVQSEDVEVVEQAFTALELLQVLQLSTSGAAIPGLALEDDASDDEEEEKQTSPSISGDLLGLDSDALGKISLGGLKKSSSDIAKASSAQTGLGKKVQDASPLLNYLLKPSPMKPVSNKAQRKKQQSGPVGHPNIDLNAPLDLSVIQGLLDEESRYLAQSKLSLESVSFTQQRPLQASPAPASGSTFPETCSILSSSGPSAVAGSSTSFQNPSVPSRPRHGDPFYLDSSPSPLAGATAGSSPTNLADDEQNRFGTMIQLPDDDDDDRPQTSKKHKKAKKKSKQSKKETSAPMPLDYLNFDPHATSKPTSQDGAILLQGMEAVVSQPQVQEAPATILDSGDEDEDDDDDGFRKPRRKSSEFSNLSKVDLTRPLAEDEVMPTANRTHRELVTEVAAPVDERKSKKQLKKERKEAKQKKKKDKATTPSTNQASAPIGDLLDLSVFGDAAPATTTSTQAPLEQIAPQHSMIASSHVMGTNPINAAFDDLLGLGAPPSTPPVLHTQTADPEVSGVSKKKGNRPWIRGSIESLQASGQPQLDWTKVRLSFRLYRSAQGGSSAAMVVVRVENQTGDNGLTGLMLDLEGLAGSLSLGNASPVAESQKVGPFLYPVADAPLEVKGTLRFSGGASVPVKLLLPATLHLTPETGLQLEQVAEQLASEPFTSSSTRIEMLTTDLEQVKKILSSFLRVGSVVETVPNPKAATFAATSSTGAKLFVLIKLKENGMVKVDFRCTNPNLANALASDLKNVMSWD